ncbi:unnamed protein product [Calypogeia fissa]
MSSSMGNNCGFNSIMSRVLAILVVLLLIQDAPFFCSARFVPENLSSNKGLKRRSLSQSNEPRTVAIDLMHVQHVDSPYMQPNLTLLQRAQNAAKSSKQRLRYFTGKIAGKKAKPFGVSHVFTSPVFSEQGNYVMQISTGTPAKTFSTFVDTGSDLIWLQCTTCTNCYQQPDPLFDPTASSTYVPMPCTDPFCSDLPVVGSYPACSTDNACLYDYVYGDNSFTKGSMAYETFTLTSTLGTATPFTNVGFGCATDIEAAGGAFDGLVGLGNGPLSLVSQLGANIGPVFSYCLVSYASVVTKTSPLLLGSAGSAVLTYTPLVSNLVNPTFYYVNLVGITVNAVPVAYPPGTFTIDPTTGEGGLVLDSGTTLSQLFDAAYVPFRAAIAAAVTYPTVSVSGIDLCYDTSSVVSPVFPAVVFQLENVNLAMPADNIFLPVDNQGTYCMFVADAGANSVLSIFGNVQQQNFEIAYDVVNSQVGFAQTTC